MTIKETVDKAIQSILQVDPDFILTRDVHLFDDLGSDEISILELVMELEDKLCCAIMDEEWQKWRYVGSIYRTLGIKSDE